MSWVAWISYDMSFIRFREYVQIHIYCIVIHEKFTNNLQIQVLFLYFMFLLKSSKNTSNDLPISINFI